MSISISGNGSFTGATADYSFDQSVGIAGTLTYEDVTSIDSVGVITARSGIDVGPTSGIGITLTSGGNITASGTGMFADTIQSAGNPVSGTATGAQLNSSGGVWVSNASATQSVFRGYTTGNSSETVRLNANGTATFVGGITSNAFIEVRDFTASDTTAILTVQPSGSNPKFAVFADGDTQIGGVIPGTPNITLNTDGSATFKAPTANGVEVQTVGGNEGTKFPFVGKNTSGTITFKVNGDGKIQSGNNYTDGNGVNIFAGGSIYIRQDGATGGVLRIRNGSDYKIELKGDGSATFAGALDVNARADIGTISLNDYAVAGFTNSAIYGGIYAQNNNASGNLFTGNENTTEVFKVTATGAATFAGNITASAKKLGTGAAGTGKVVGYQQGTWTPVYAESGNTNNEATNYASRTAYWWRIGDVVTVTATLNMASSAGISPNNALILKDFPYVCQNANAYYGSSSSVHANGWVDNTVVYVNIIVPSNTTKADLYYTTSSQSGNYNGVDYSKIGTGSLIFNLSYLTDDSTWTPVNGASVAS